MVLTLFIILTSMLLLEGELICELVAWSFYSLEYWCFEILVILAGLLPNPQLELATLSVWYVMWASYEFQPFNVSWEPYIQKRTLLCRIQKMSQTL